MIDFLKICKYQIYWNPSSESWVIPYGQTDRQTWWN